MATLDELSSAVRQASSRVAEWISANREIAEVAALEVELCPLVPAATLLTSAADLAEQAGRSDLAATILEEANNVSTTDATTTDDASDAGLGSSVLDGEESGSASGDTRIDGGGGEEVVGDSGSADGESGADAGNEAGSGDGISTAGSE